MSENLSKRINVLRFPMIVLVVFIHNNSSTLQNTMVAGGLKTVCSEIIARAAVPLFFLFSGYLLFVKSKKYTEVLKKKAVTLLIPYLFWNVFSVLLFWTGQNLPFLSGLFTDETNMISSYSLMQWLDAFLGLNAGGYPIVYPLWFLRDLMVLTLLYPIGKWLIDRVPLTTLGIMLILWIKDIRFLFISSEALLFFFLGYYAVKYCIDIEETDKLRYPDLLLLYAAAIMTEVVLFLKGLGIQGIHKLNIILGILVLLKLSKKLVGSEKMYQKLAALSGYAFFVYAFHEPFLTLLRKVWDKVFMTQSTAGLLIQYFGLVAVIILLALGIAWCLKKLMPKFYALITGGRA